MTIAERINLHKCGYTRAEIDALAKEEKEAKNIIKFSQSARLFLLFGVALAGYLIPVFNIIAVVIPFLFPRIAVMLRPLADKIKR